MPAFFTFPLADISKQVESVARAVRTLPADQLNAELGELRGISESSVVGKLMLSIYERERLRRASPEYSFDEELDEALGRLESATTAEDRERVSAIGRELWRVGGQVAQDRVGARMIELARPTRRELRASILAKRWA